jgi:hypothetical protein
MNKIKNKILSYVLKGYTRSIRKKYRLLYEQDIELYKATLDIKDLIRERLKGIRPNHPEDNSILHNYIAGLDDVSRLAFLSKAHDVLKNDTFKVVCESVIEELIQKAVLHSKDMSEVDFNRASINGVSLIEEELFLLNKSYLEEKKNSRPISTEESFEIL